MAERDAHAGSCQRCDKAGRHAFRRQRHQRRAAALLGQQRQIRIVRRAEHRRIVHARRARATGTAPRNGCRARRGRDASPLRPPRARGASSRGVSLIRVGSSPVVPKRRCAAAIAGDAFRGRTIVEQHVAAAIDLHVDEARGQPCPRRHRAQRNARRQIAARHQGGDIGALDHDGAVAVQRGAVEHDIGGDGVALARFIAPRHRALASRPWSSGARDLLQMARPVRVDVEPRRQRSRIIA